MTKVGNVVLSRMLMLTHFAQNLYTPENKHGAQEFVVCRCFFLFHVFFQVPAASFSGGVVLYRKNTTGSCALLGGWIKYHARRHEVGSY